MRILVVSNVYPPHYIGGYELGCRDVVEALRARGHEVFVLTSTYCHDPAIRNESEAGVERTLHFAIDDTSLRHRKLREARVLAQTLRRRRPDVVYFWNQSGLSHWLPMVAGWLGYRLAFFLSDPVFRSWRVAAFLTRWSPTLSQTPLARAIRSIFGQTFLICGWPVIQEKPCHFASHFLRLTAQQNGIAVDDRQSAVIHWGIEPSHYSALLHEPRPQRRLLYVGQMIPQKGVHTAIAALGLMIKERSSVCSLTLVGGGTHLEYERKLRDMPAQLGIEDQVHFLGKVPRAELPGIYAQHGILVFPSEWEEPFAITPLEAMAAGLVVVGTTTGGSGELFRNRETAMTFVAGDANDCARAIRELLIDPALYNAIQSRGSAEVNGRHTLSRMVDAIETSLQKLKARSVAPGKVSNGSHLSCK